MSERRIAPHRLLAAEARRLFTADLDAIANGLSLARENRDAGLHEARKSIKKARALLKLLRFADTEFYAAENARLRDLARSLAHARDAAALVEAVERLRLTYPDRAKALGLLKVLLEERRDRRVIEDGALDILIEQGLQNAAQIRREVDRWRLPGEPEAAASILADGVRDNLARAMRALERASGRAENEDFHDLRKTVKAHWTQLGLLRDFWPKRVKTRRARLEALGESLGEHNDLAALAALLRSRELDLKPSHVRLFREIVAKRKAALALSTVKAGRRLLERTPKRLKSNFVQRLQADGEPAVAANPALYGSRL
jgi:CHAD domain-containing protein